ncbi:MAG: helix-turn-helix transcriptional regulator [Planctomycetes bacterium]|nr:helix-turn-helix transcriptional regulator [Planctomycetota bacterium]
MSRKKRRSGCPISFALELFGDRWTLLVVRDLVFMGKRRFSEFSASSEGVATNVLSDRLRRLVEAGVIESLGDPDDGRRVLYHLTPAGVALIPTLVELANWGALHDPDTAAPAEFVRRFARDRAGLIEDLAAKHRRD